MAAIVIIKEVVMNNTVDNTIWNNSAGYIVSTKTGYDVYYYWMTFAIRSFGSKKSLGKAKSVLRKREASGIGCI